MATFLRLILCRAYCLLAVGALMACGETMPPVTDCNALGDRKALCGFHNPEDLEPLGDGRTLIVSQMGIVGQHTPGSLAFFDVKAKHLKIFPDFTEADSEHWGQETCEPPGKAFSPHGIHLSRLNEHTQRLLVVNHGGREAVESFLIRREGDDFQISWQGCVEMPENSNINDVVAGPDGGFFTTHMFAMEGLSLGPINWPQLEGLLGFDTGWVWHWQPENGGEFSKVKNFRSAFPNGIQIDPEGKYLYVNSWGDNEVCKLDWRTGEILASAEMLHPDNVQWGDNGHLLVASQHFDLASAQQCMDLREGACPSRFDIVEIDPQDMSHQIVLEQQGPPMGAGTVAQVLGDYMYIGSFAGDRLLRVPKPSTASVSEDERN
ncbi:hypothetical protein [Pseudoteredinibacter isoporae]|uniref:hypothetical protein n=1 Tax=Pseudoteredinibacter isoporae TaxID=570281 RepID=UPI003109F7C5